jgi:glutamine amidotransferase
MKTVAIIDYGMGNVDSVARAVEECGCKPVLTDARATIAQAGAVILPGVGAFGDGMRELRARELDRLLLDEVVRADVPLLGICLGMQLLADHGTEGGEHKGLGFIPGAVQVLNGTGERVPHVGWNEVNHASPHPLFDGIDSGKDFYFVHSFHVVPNDDAVVLARTPYCGGFVSTVNSGRVYGTQFHPEKSQRPGLQLLRNFLTSC